MASRLLLSSDAPAEGAGTPQTADSSETAQTEQTAQSVQYAETADLRTSQEASKKESRWRMWKRWREGQKSDWWFAGTGIPLLAATLGPLANICSLAALVTSWRANVDVDGQIVPDFDGDPFADPRWCYWLNVASLICGFLGNLFLLLNFTQRIRYIIALPLTIILWYLSTGFLIGITVCMAIYAPPNRPHETYTQGFWYAIASAFFYLICSMILMVNMLGYFLGHYPDHFALTDAQRTLILQTMLFFIWLGGGAAVFSRLESEEGVPGWEFADALYFCDVTILTVGFGDLYPTTDVSRGLIFPYSVGGIIMLGLVISSIYKFMKQLGEDHIVQAHIDRMRARTVSRTVDNSLNLRQREHAAHHLIRRHSLTTTPQISGPSEGRSYRTPAVSNTKRRVAPGIPNPIRRKKPRLLLLREEKDRFEAMRGIQAQTHQFKKWTALIFSIFAFGILWCFGAIVFWRAEKDAQDMTYFRALYFCYISLLTIGYGDLSPKTNAGRCFFVIWSLIAVPTMTILISDMGDTVIQKFKKVSNELADFTVLPKDGAWRAFLDKHPWLLAWLQKWVSERQAKKRLKRGFEVEDPNILKIDEGMNDATRIMSTASGAGSADAESALALAITNPPPNRRHLTPGTLRTNLALSIRLVATDLKLPTPRRYCYEEWVEFTRLLRYSSNHARKGIVEQEEEEEGLVNWDWIGEDSPLIARGGESEWLLTRLTEALVRVERRGERERHAQRKGSLEREEGKRRVRERERRSQEGELRRIASEEDGDELRKLRSEEEGEALGWVEMEGEEVKRRRRDVLGKEENKEAEREEAEIDGQELGRSDTGTAREDNAHIEIVQDTEGEKRKCEGRLGRAKSQVLASDAETKSS